MPELAWGHPNVKSGLRMLTSVLKPKGVSSRGLVTAVSGISLEQSGSKEGSPLRASGLLDNLASR